MNKEDKIYIAGHRGLVGSAILKNLQERGYSNFVLRTHAELELCDQDAVNRFFDEEMPDYVFLAAAHVGGIMANNRYRADFIYRNLQIQNNVIHNAWRTGVKKLLFLGSTCIYPRDAPQPMSEDCLLTSPLEYTNEPYAIAKIAGLKMCESYNLQYGTNFIAVMPTNLYGPNDNFDLERSHVLPALIRKMHLGKCLQANDWVSLRQDLNRNPIECVNNGASETEILAILAKYGVRVFQGTKQTSSSPWFTAQNNVSVEIWGTGTPLREFLWSEDMADACVYIMKEIFFADLYDREQDIRNSHINIGTGQELSIHQLAELIAKIVGFTGQIIFNTNKPDGAKRKLADSRKLCQLGWQHKIDISTGISQVYQWYRTF